MTNISRIDNLEDLTDYFSSVSEDFLSSFEAIETPDEVMTLIAERAGVTQAFFTEGCDAGLFEYPADWKIEAIAKELRQDKSLFETFAREASTPDFLDEIADAEIVSVVTVNFLLQVMDWAASVAEAGRTIEYGNPILRAQCETYAAAVIDAYQKSRAQ